MTTTTTTCVHVANFSMFKFKVAPSNPSGFCNLVPLSRPGLVISRANYFRLGAYYVGERWYLSDMGKVAYGNFLKVERVKRKRRDILVRFNEGFGFNGGGGYGRDEGLNARLLGNIALALGLTYLSVTGQLGWLLDTIVSIWLFIVIVPVVGVAALLWWAGQDIVQSACPNCRNEFQVFKSFLNDDLQLCPYCGQPFSVVGNEFVKESVKFSNQSTTFGEVFRNFSNSGHGNPQLELGKDSGAQFVDIEAEVKDAD